MPEFIEYGVVAIKPDGYGDAAVESAALEGLHAAGLTIIAECDIRLTAVDVTELSHRTDPETTAYLVSGPCRVLLVRGVSALAAIDRVKRAVRRFFGVENRIRNLVHAVDAGKELAEWLRRYFPECDEPQARGTADQYWLPPDVDGLRDGLGWAARVHPHGVVIPVLARDALGTAVYDALSEGGARWLGVIEPDPGPALEDFEAVRYFAVDERGRPHGEGLRALGRTASMRDDYTDGMRTAAAAGFRCVLTNSDLYTFFHLDLLDEAGAGAGLIVLAGSGPSPRPFVTANSCAQLENFARALTGA